VRRACRLEAALVWSLSMVGRPVSSADGLQPALVGLVVNGLVTKEVSVGVDATCAVGFSIS